MNNSKRAAQSAFFNLRILITLLLCAVAACSLVSGPLLAFFRPNVPVPAMNPHGLFQLDGGWTNAVADGVSMRRLGTTKITWKVLEPSEEQYDWSQLDSWIATAKANHKQIAYSFGALADPPQWLIDLGAKTYQWTGGYANKTRTVVMPWDPIVQPRLLRFIAAFGAHVDGKFDYTVMGGVGLLNESYMPEPSTVDETAETMLPKWIDSCNAIITAYGQAFHMTPFIFAAAAPPIRGYAASTTALESICRTAAAKYPGLFGVMCDGLKATSNYNYVPNKLVSDLSANPTGFQFVTGDLHGTLQQTLDTAISLKAHFIEAYPLYMSDPQHAQAFLNASAQMAITSGAQAHKQGLTFPLKGKIKHN